MDRGKISPLRPRRENAARLEAALSWDLKFYEPIPLPGRRKPLATLRDAVLYRTSLRRAEQNAEHRPAATLLGIIGERAGCVVLARIAVMYGLRKGVQAPPREYDPERPRDRRWGKRRLRRDK
jgi:hypothetical protein